MLRNFQTLYTRSGDKSMVATQVEKDKSQRSTIKITNEITYLAASPSSQVLNCIPAPYNCGFVGGKGETRKEFTSKASETNNLFIWKFFSRTVHWGNISKMNLHKGKAAHLFLFLFIYFFCCRCRSITNCCHVRESSAPHSQVGERECPLPPGK